MPETPEQKARRHIDANLKLAGWKVQDRADLGDQRAQTEQEGAQSMKRTTRRPTSSTSKAPSYEEMGGYWDAHDVPSSRSGGRPVDFTVDIRRRRYMVAIEPALFAKVRRRAAKRGLSAEGLLNLWVREKCVANR